MGDLVSKIAKVDGSEIGEILDAVLHRYAELFPQWEMTVISLEKHKNRNDQLDEMIQLLESMKMVISQKGALCSAPLHLCN